MRGKGLRHGSLKNFLIKEQCAGACSARHREFPIKMCLLAHCGHAFFCSRVNNVVIFAKVHADCVNAKVGCWDSAA